MLMPVGQTYISAIWESGVHLCLSVILLVILADYYARILSTSIVRVYCIYRDKPSECIEHTLVLAGNLPESAIAAASAFRAC